MAMKKVTLLCRRLPESNLLSGQFRYAPTRLGCQGRKASLRHFNSNPNAVSTGDTQGTRIGQSGEGQGAGET